MMRLAPTEGKHPRCIIPRLMREALAEGGNAEAVLSHFLAQTDSGVSDALRSVLRKRPGRRPG